MSPYRILSEPQSILNKSPLCAAQAIASLSAPVTRINELLYTKKGRKQQDRLAVLASLVRAVAATLRLLGLPADQPQDVLQVQHTKPEMKVHSATLCMTMETQVAGACDGRHAAPAGPARRSAAGRAAGAIEGFSLMRN